MTTAYDDFLANPNAQTATDAYAAIASALAAAIDSSVKNYANDTRNFALDALGKVDVSDEGNLTI